MKVGEKHGICQKSNNIGRLFFKDVTDEYFSAEDTPFLGTDE